MEQYREQKEECVRKYTQAATDHVLSGSKQVESGAMRKIASTYMRYGGSSMVLSNITAEVHSQVRREQAQNGGAGI